MKNSLLLSILLLTFLAGFMPISNAQNFELTSPPSVAGGYLMQPADFGGDVTLSIWTGTLEFVNDTTSGTIPEEGCNGPLGTDLTGKIAVIDRGSCQFGTKSLNAENAGAIAVIICNNVNGTFLMTPADDGGMVTIPVVMMGKEVCDMFRTEIATGNVVGTLGNFLFPNDLSMSLSSPIGMEAYAIPVGELQNSGDYVLNPGARITNKGSNDQTNVTLSVDVDFDNGSTSVNVYSGTGTLDVLPAGVDSIVQITPDFDFSGSGEGVYTVNYSFVSDSTDVFPNDNSWSYPVHVTSNTLSKTTFDPATAAPRSDLAYSVTGGGSFEFGPVYYIKNGDNRHMCQASFTIFSNNATLSGIELSVSVYKFNDADGNNFLDAAGTELTPVGFSPPFTFSTEANFEFVNVDLLDFTTFEPGIQLENDGIYFVSVVYPGSDQVFIGVDDDVDFSEFIINKFENNLEHMHACLKDAAGVWFGRGFGARRTPAVPVQLSDIGFNCAGTPLANSKLQASQFKIEILSNPIKNQLNVQVEFNTEMAMMRYEISDVNGRLIHSENRSQIQTDNFSLDVSDYAPGVYMLTVKTEEGFKTEKFVVSK